MTNTAILDCSWTGPRLAQHTSQFCKILPIFRYIEMFAVPVSELSYRDENMADVCELFTQTDWYCGLYFRTALLQQRCVERAQLAKIFRYAIQISLSTIFESTLATVIQLNGPAELQQIITSYAVVFPKIQFENSCTELSYTQTTKCVEYSRNSVVKSATCPRLNFETFIEIDAVGIDIGSSSIKWIGKDTAGYCASEYIPLYATNRHEQISQLLQELRTKYRHVYITGSGRYAEPAASFSPINEISAQRSVAQQLARSSNIDIRYVLDIGAHDYKLIVLNSVAQTIVNSRCQSSFGLFVSELLQLLYCSWDQAEKHLVDTTITSVPISEAVCSEQALQDFYNARQHFPIAALLTGAFIWICQKLPTVLQDIENVVLTGKLSENETFCTVFQNYFQIKNVFRYQNAALSGAVGAIYTNALLRPINFQQLHRIKYTILKETDSSIEVALNIGPGAIPADLGHECIWNDLTVPAQHTQGKLKWCLPLARLKQALSVLKAQYQKEIVYHGYISSAQHPIFQNCPFLVNETSCKLVLQVASCTLDSCNSQLTNTCLAYDLTNCISTESILQLIAYSPVFHEPSCRFSCVLQSTLPNTQFLEVHPNSKITEATLEDLIMVTE